jgi:hypothetical protein
MMTFPVNNSRPHFIPWRPFLEFEIQKHLKAITASGTLSSGQQQTTGSLINPPGGRTTTSYSDGSWKD